jgi:hypothetical protein
MDDPTTTIDTYFRMWNETDPASRARLVEQVWTADGRHVDPLADVQGHAALDELVAGVQATYPDNTFRRTTGIDAHHGHLRYGWELTGPDGTLVVSAIDVAELDGDGRLRQVTAFFGELPEQQAA